MSNKPIIKFLKDNESWKRMKLSDFCQRIQRKNTELESDVVLTISAQRGLIPQGDFFNKRIASDQIGGYYLIKKGEFAYNKSYSSDYPVGAVKQLTNLDEGVLSTLYIIFSIDNNLVDAGWLSAYFESSCWHKEILKRASEGARNHGLLNISSTDFFDIPIKVLSSKSEQTAIATFFSQLDNYISFEEAQLENLKNIKKACLEKMFPQKGSLVPEMRFKQFKGEWKAGKLSDYLEPSVEKNLQDNYNKYDIFSVSGDYGVVNQIEFQGKSFAGASLLNYKVTHKGQVIYTKSPLKAQPYGIIKTNKSKDGIVSQLYAVYNNKAAVSTEFIQVYFELDSRLNDYLRPIVKKGAKNTLLVSDEDALNGIVVFPESIKEQTMITNYFTALNNQINGCLSKLVKLKHIRKGLLERMFVGNE